jgi:hypothetical protein
MHRPDIGLAEIGNGLLAAIRNAHPDKDRDRQPEIAQRLFELGLLGLFIIKMQRVRVHCWQGEPDIVGISDRPSGAMFIDVADDEFPK